MTAIPGRTINVNPTPTKECPTCLGTGKLDDNQTTAGTKMCWRCMGRGRIYP